MPVLLRLLAAAEGTTAAAAGLALGKSKQSALNYLTALRDRGVAAQAGAGRGHRWHLVRAAPGAPREPAAEAALTRLQPQPYLTLENLAEFVLAGLVEADEEQRVNLEQAHDMIRRKRLALVKDGGDDTP